MKAEFAAYWGFGGQSDEERETRKSVDPRFAALSS
jgi:hypothetical protein